MARRNDDANGTVRRRTTENSKIDERIPEEQPKASFYDIVSSSLPEWINLITIGSLIFGGCCANVFALEAIITEAPGSGTLITCTQFCVTALLSLWSQVDRSRGIRHFYFKPRAIPLKKWVIYTAMFLTINVLNNMAFDYKISVPLHIILRSAGPVTTMAVGHLAGKRYTRVQVLAVTLLFLGVIQAAIADAISKGRQINLLKDSSTSHSDLIIGFGLLFLALLLSAIMGVYTDRIYTTHGRNHWGENLFYSHTIALPFFMLYWSDLKDQAQAVLASPNANMVFVIPPASSEPFFVLRFVGENVSIQAALLAINAFTQYLCIRGVNKLSAQSSSLTVTIVLNIRKLVSLLLSIWLFGNRLAPGVVVGALLVFLGGGLYALPDKKPTPSRKKASRKTQ